MYIMLRECACQMSRSPDVRGLVLRISVVFAASDSGEPASRMMIDRWIEWGNEWCQI